MDGAALTPCILTGQSTRRGRRGRSLEAWDLPQDCGNLADPLSVARQQHVPESADSTARARTSTNGYDPTPQQFQAADQVVVQDVTAQAILSAVEEQLTRYFGAMAARADAVQQAAEAGRAELINYF